MSRSGKTTFPCTILIQHGCHRCPVALDVKSTVELKTPGQEEQTESMERCNLDLSNKLEHDGKT